MSLLKETGATNEKKETLWGWPAKNWVNLIVIVSVSALIIFVALPFLLSLIIPFCVNDTEKFVVLVDTLDGVALVLGLMGTIASIVSIIMTIADQKRFRNEKEQTEQLVNSVCDLHKELGVVDSYVRKTFETNRQLSAQLYEAKIINKPKDQADVGVSLNTDSVNWSNVNNAKEIPLSEESI